MSIETDIGRTILSVERGLESLEQPPDEMEPADDGEGDEDQLPSDPPPAPRRASLATDTTGGPTYS